MIRIVDYGVGNIQAFLNVYKSLGVVASRAKTAHELQDATHLILPGVGSFDHAMHLLNTSEMREELEGMVLKQKIPVLGICVGMQMLSESSDEGELAGLNWIPGKVRHFSSIFQNKKLPLPHMGWNIIKPSGAHPLFKGFPEESRFYFLHSYCFDTSSEHVLASADYGSGYPAVVGRDNIYGIQCHPEKSHKYGTLLLKNFAEL